MTRTHILSLLRVIDRITTPPDKWIYVFPETGYRVRQVDYGAWVREIRRHYLDNGIPMPDDWLEQAEHQLCQSLPPGHCQYENGGEPDAFINRRFGVGDAINGTNVLLEFVKQGCPIVPQEVAEARAKTCAACYALVGIPGCSSCTGFANIVADACGARSTQSDHLLETKVCGVCHCSARANVWIPVKVSKQGVTDEMMKTFPGFCWKRNEILAIGQPVV